jgi:hypothetical protein
LANRPLKTDVGDFTACGVNLVIILFQYTLKLRLDKGN